MDSFRFFKLGTHPNDKNGVLVFKQYDLEQFYNETNTLNCMQDFEKLCKQFDVPIKIQDKFTK